MEEVVGSIPTRSTNSPNNLVQASAYAAGPTDQGVDAAGGWLVAG
jgi:hypothetical protein